MVLERSRHVRHVRHVRQAALVLAMGPVLAGCFDDAVPVGSYCGAGGSCGGDLECVENYCRPQKCAKDPTVCRFYAEFCTPDVPDACNAVGARGCVVPRGVDMGICAVSCPDNDAPCPANAASSASPICVEATLEDTPVGLCVLECQDTADCPTDMACEPGEVGGQTLALCVPIN